MKRNLTTGFIDRTMADHDRLYRLIFDRQEVTDPDQRMMDDAEMWVERTVGLVSSVFQPSVQMAWWLIRIGQILAWWLPVAITAYMLIAYMLMGRIAKGYKAICEKEQKLLDTLV